MSGSKKSWAKRHLNDHYVKQANVEGYRSRAAYKLKEIIEKYSIIQPGDKIVELGAAPGAWTQLLTEVTQSKSQIVACDLLMMDAVEGVAFVQGDFLLEETQKIIRDRLNGNCDIVISDMSPDLTGSDITDQARMHELVTSILGFCQKCLSHEGFLLLKLFNGRDFQEMVTDIRKCFLKTRVIKPGASRASSKEVYLLAEGFRL